MAARKRKPTNSTRNGTVDPSKPLAKPSRELFAQDVAAGLPVKDAYVRAGYKGNDVSRYELRRCADIDSRVNWLLAQRIEADTKRRHASEKPIADLKTRVVRELERLAFSDTREIVQWQRVPVLDADGNVTGFRDEMTPTPSHNLKASAAAAVKGVSAKSGSLKIEMHDKLAALAQLAKILGLSQDAAPSTNVTVNQLNMNSGPETAFEAARRLAFALAKAQQSGALVAKDPQIIDGESSEAGNYLDREGVSEK
jgi:Terminase small subunit